MDTVTNNGSCDAGNGTTQPRALPPLGEGGDAKAGQSLAYENHFNPEFGEFDCPEAQVLTPTTVVKLGRKVEKKPPSHAAVDAAANAEDPKSADATFCDSQRLSYQQSGGLDFYGFVEGVLTGANEKRKVLWRLSKAYTSEMKSMCPVSWEPTGKFFLPGNMNEVMAVVLVIGFALVVSGVISGETSVMVRMLELYAPDMAGDDFWGKVAFALPALLLPTLFFKYLQTTVKTTAARWVTALLLLLGGVATVSVFTLYPLGILGSATDPMAGESTEGINKIWIMVCSFGCVALINTYAFDFLLRGLYCFLRRHLKVSKAWELVRQQAKFYAYAIDELDGVRERLEWRLSELIREQECFVAEALAIVQNRRIEIARERQQLQQRQQIAARKKELASLEASAELGL